uniref:Uncharacterized protein n=1 Tax=Strongyloides venezuelensis TaxID=75913 RepID=A0A0K0FUD8_STRVS
MPNNFGRARTLLQTQKLSRGLTSFEVAPQVNSNLKCNDEASLRNSDLLDHRSFPARKKNICSSEKSDEQKNGSHSVKIRNLLRLFKKKDSCQIPDDDFMDEKDSNPLVGENDDTN